MLGLTDEAIAAGECGVELEPFTIIFNASLAWWYYVGRRNDEAIAQALKTIEIAPNHFFAYWVLGLAYALTGRNEEAVTTLQEGIKVSGFVPHLQGELGRVFAQAGLIEEAREVLAALQEKSGTEYISAVNHAKIYAGLGENDLLFEWIEKAFEERSVKLPYFMIDPCLDLYHSDPRFVDITQRMGLPDRNV